MDKAPEVTPAQILRIYGFPPAAKYLFSESTWGSGRRRLCPLAGSVACLTSSQAVHVCDCSVATCMVCGNLVKVLSPGLPKYSSLEGIIGLPMI